MTNPASARRFGNLSEEEFVSGMKEYFNINKLDLCDSEEQFNQLSQIALREKFDKLINDSVVRCGDLAVHWKGLDIIINRIINDDSGVFDGHDVVIKDTGSSGVMKFRNHSAVEWFADMWLYSRKLVIQESQITIRDKCELKGDNFFKFSKFDADAAYFENANMRQFNGAALGLLVVNSRVRGVALHHFDTDIDIGFTDSDVNQVKLSGKVVIQSSTVDNCTLIDSKVTRSYINMRESTIANATVTYARAVTREKHISGEIHKVVPVLIPNSSDNIVTLLITSDGPMVISGEKAFTLGNWYKNEIQNSNNQVAKLAYLAASSFMDTHSDFYKFCGK